MKILVVDDEPDTYLLFQQHFKKEIELQTLEFYYANSGEEALHLVETNRSILLILILSDINMPGMNAMTLLKLIKECYPNIQVIMTTAYENENLIQEMQKYDVQTFISKPIDFDILKTFITNLAKNGHIKNMGVKE